MHRSIRKKDASNAYKLWLEEQKFVCVEGFKVVSEIKRTKRGRPGLHDKAIIHFHILGTVMLDHDLRQEAEQNTGLFILSTNDLSDRLEMQFLLDEYKSQQAVERGFRFLKNPEFLTSSLFLKKPERIEALLMVMTCSLTIYAAIEHLIRRQLKHHHAYFPDMKNKPYQKPTARWVFLCFQGIDELTINGSAIMILNLSDSQKTVLYCLGKTYQDVYS